MKGQLAFFKFFRAAFLSLPVFLFSLQCTPVSEKVVVSDAEGLLRAVRSGKDTVYVKDGIYSDVELVISGKEDGCPLVISAETPGKVIVKGKSSLTIATGNTTLTGFYFQSPLTEDGGLEKNPPVINITGDHNRVTQCAFYQCHNRVCIAAIYQEKEDRMPQYNRIDHCYFGDNLGWRLYLDLGKTVPSDDLRYAMYNRIDHNYFSSPFKLQANTGSSMRLGLGQPGYGRCLVDHNLFERQDGEVELVENKSHENVYIFNTFRNCRAQMSFRQGHRTVFLHNILEGTDSTYRYGGLGMWMDGHIVAGNYFSFPYGSYIPLDKKMQPRSDKGPAAVVRFICGYKDFIQEDGSYATHLAAQNSYFFNNTFYNCSDPLFDLSYSENCLPRMHGYPASRPFGNVLSSNVFIWPETSGHKIFADENPEDLKLNQYEDNAVWMSSRTHCPTLSDPDIPGLDSISCWMHRVFPDVDSDLKALAGSRVADPVMQKGRIKIRFSYRPARFEDVAPDWLEENPSEFIRKGRYDDELLSAVRKNINGK